MLEFKEHLWYGSNDIVLSRGSKFFFGLHVEHGWWYLNFFIIKGWLRRKYEKKCTFFNENLWKNKGYIRIHFIYK